MSVGTIITRHPGSFASYDAYTATNGGFGALSRSQWDAVRADFLSQQGQSGGGGYAGTGGYTGASGYTGTGGGTAGAGASGSGTSNNALAQAGRDAANLADPYAPRRAKYADQLDSLTANPGDVTSSPLYKFLQEQGVNAIDRAAAAKGQLNSGNRLAELQKFGTGLAADQYFKQADLLALLSGAKTGSPSAAGNALLSGAEAANSADYRDRALAQSGDQFSRSLALQQQSADRNYELAKAGDQRAQDALNLQSLNADRNYGIALSNADLANASLGFQQLNANNQYDMELIRLANQPTTKNALTGIPSYRDPGNVIPGTSGGGNPWPGL